MAKSKAAAKSKVKPAAKKKSASAKKFPKRSASPKPAERVAKRAPKKTPAKKLARKNASSRATAAKKKSQSLRAGAKTARNTAKKTLVQTVEKLVFGTIEQVEHFSASPEVVYRALTDSKAHAAFTGAVARMTAKIGGAFSAWGGYVKGRVVDLVPGEKIVQAWRTTDFPREYPDSNLEINLTPESGGTRLRLRHTNVPENSVESYDSGWHSNYWQPLRAWLSTLPQLELPFGAAPARSKKRKTSSKSARA